MTPPYFSPREQSLREEIVLVGKLMYERGLIVATDGNISARLDENTILITPSGLCKGLMIPDQLITIDMAGQGWAGYSGQQEPQAHLGNGYAPGSLQTAA